MRRVLYAFGGDGNIAIHARSRDAVRDQRPGRGARNDASWNDLFVKAIANFVMCASGYQAPTREEALRQEISRPRRCRHRRLHGAHGLHRRARVLLAYRLLVDIDADWEARNQWNDACRRRAERIDNVEARWLAERIGKDGRLQENELALVRFIKQTSPAIHPELKPLFEKVA